MCVWSRGRGTRLSGRHVVAGDDSLTITDFEGAVGRETVVTIDNGNYNPTNGTGGFTVIPEADCNLRTQITVSQAAVLAVAEAMIHLFPLDPTVSNESLIGRSDL